MHNAIATWTTTYPKSPGWRDGTFEGAVAAKAVREDVPRAIAKVLGEEAARYIIRASPGDLLP
jgi:hypothetical protein